MGKSTFLRLVFLLSYSEQDRYCIPKGAIVTGNHWRAALSLGDPTWLLTL